MERSKKKAINFDLDTTIMRSMQIYPVGYSMLTKAFRDIGFIHRQGSGYISKGKLTNSDVNFIIRKIVKENLWLAECVKKIDVTDIGKQHDLTSIVKTIGAQYAEEAAAQQQAREERRAARGIAEPRKAEARQQSIAAGTAAALERLKAMCPMYQLEVASGGKEAADAKFNAAMKRPKTKMSGKGNAGQNKPAQRVRGKGKEKGKGKA